MAIILRLQGLPWSASAMDIRNFFHGLDIPVGGVHIVGGESGDVFIAFNSDKDASTGMRLQDRPLCGSKIRILLSSKAEMHEVITQSRSGPQSRRDSFPSTSQGQASSALPSSAPSQQHDSLGSGDVGMMGLAANRFGRDSSITPERRAGNLPTDVTPERDPEKRPPNMRQEFSYQDYPYGYAAHGKTAADASPSNPQLKSSMDTFSKQEFPPSAYTQPEQYLMQAQMGYQRPTGKPDEFHYHSNQQQFGYPGTVSSKAGNPSLAGSSVPGPSDTAHLQAALHIAREEERRKSATPTDRSGDSASSTPRPRDQHERSPSLGQSFTQQPTKDAVVGGIAPDQSAQRPGVFPALTPEVAKKVVIPEGLPTVEQLRSLFPLQNLPNMNTEEGNKRGVPATTASLANPENLQNANAQQAFGPKHFQTQGNYRDMIPTDGQRQDTGTRFQERPDAGTRFQERPDAGIRFQERPDANARFQEPPDANARFQERPDANARFQERPDPNARFQDRQDANARFQGGQELSSDPYRRGTSAQGIRDYRQGADGGFPHREDPRAGHKPGAGYPPRQEPGGDLRHDTNSGYPQRQGLSDEYSGDYRQDINAGFQQRWDPYADYEQHAAYQGEGMYPTGPDRQFEKSQISESAGFGEGMVERSRLSRFDDDQTKTHRDISQPSDYYSHPKESDEFRKNKMSKSQNLYGITPGSQTSTGAEYLSSSTEIEEPLDEVVPTDGKFPRSKLGFQSEKEFQNPSQISKTERALTGDIRNQNIPMRKNTIVDLPLNSGQPLSERDIYSANDSTMGFPRAGFKEGSRHWANQPLDRNRLPGMKQKEEVTLHKPQSNIGKSEGSPVVHEAMDDYFEDPAFPGAPLGIDESNSKHEPQSDPNEMPPWSFEGPGLGKKSNERKRGMSPEKPVKRTIEPSWNLPREAEHQFVSVDTKQASAPLKIRPDRDERGMPPRNHSEVNPYGHSNVHHEMFPGLKERGEDASGILGDPPGILGNHPEANRDKLHRAQEGLKFGEGTHPALDPIVPFTPDVLKVVGLPIDCKEGHVAHFFHGIRIAPGGILMQFDPITGEKTGQALVQFIHPREADKGLKLDGAPMNRRPVHVFRCPLDEWGEAESTLVRSKKPQPIASKAADMDMYGMEEQMVIDPSPELEGPYREGSRQPLKRLRVPPGEHDAGHYEQDRPFPPNKRRPLMDFRDDSPRRGSPFGDRRIDEHTIHDEESLDIRGRRPHPRRHLSDKDPFFPDDGYRPDGLQDPIERGNLRNKRGLPADEREMQGHPPFTQRSRGLTHEDEGFHPRGSRMELYRHNTDEFTDEFGARADVRGAHDLRQARFGEEEYLDDERGLPENRGRGSHLERDPRFGYDRPLTQNNHPLDKQNQIPHRRSRFSDNLDPSPDGRARVQDRRGFTDDLSLLSRAERGIPEVGETPAHLARPARGMPLIDKEPLLDIPDQTRKQHLIEPHPADTHPRSGEKESSFGRNGPNRGQLQEQGGPPRLGVRPGISVSRPDVTPGARLPFDVQRPRGPRPAHVPAQPHGREFSTCFELKGLPSDADTRACVHFFQGIQIALGSVFIEKNLDGQSLGTAYLEIANSVQFPDAIGKSGKYMGRRAIDVKSISKEAMDEKIKQAQQRMLSRDNEKQQMIKSSPVQAKKEDSKKILPSHEKDKPDTEKDKSKDKQEKSGDDKGRSVRDRDRSRERDRGRDRDRDRDRRDRDRDRDRERDRDKDRRSDRDRDRDRNRDKDQEKDRNRSRDREQSKSKTTKPEPGGKDQKNANVSKPASTTTTSTDTENKSLPDDKSKPIVKSEAKLDKADEKSKLPSKQQPVKPVFTPPAKPAVKPAVKPVVTPPAKPAVKPAFTPPAKPAVKPAFTPPAKPAVKPAFTPPAKPVVKSAFTPPAKPDFKPLEKPVSANEACQSPGYGNKIQEPTNVKSQSVQGPANDKKLPKLVSLKTPLLSTPKPLLSTPTTTAGSLGSKQARQLTAPAPLLNDPLPNKPPSLLETPLEKVSSATTNCLFVVNIPYAATDSDVYHFFEGFRIPPGGIHLLRDDLGKSTGKAYIEFASEDIARRANERHAKRLWDRFPVINLISKGQMIEGLGTENSPKMRKPALMFEPLLLPHANRRGMEGDFFEGGPRGYGMPPRFMGPRPMRGRGMGGPRMGGPLPRMKAAGRGCVLSLTNLNPSVTFNALAHFFEEYDYLPGSVRIIRGDMGQPTGEAIVAFPNPGEAMRAMKELNNTPLTGRNVRLKIMNP